MELWEAGGGRGEGEAAGPWRVCSAREEVAEVVTASCFQEEVAGLPCSQFSLGVVVACSVFRSGCWCRPADEII